MYDLLSAICKVICALCLIYRSFREIFTYRNILLYIVYVDMFDARVFFCHLSYRHVAAVLNWYIELFDLL